MGMNMMTEKEFKQYWDMALQQEDSMKFLSECRSILKDTYTADLEHELINIHKVAHMSMREIVQLSGLSQARFADKYCIPFKSLVKWYNGERKCSDYIRLMICKDMGLLNNITYLLMYEDALDITQHEIITDEAKMRSRLEEIHENPHSKNISVVSFMNVKQIEL